ncbi:MAG: hypothetical protein IJ323_06315 [Clostridia bacterium]|nr:hypothetical protein [Clostridia bacterium]
MENILPRILVTITNAGNEKKLKEVFDRSDVPVSFSCPAQGTAPSAIMDIFGLSGRTRVISAGLTVKSRVSEIFDKLSESLDFANKGKGIAFTIALTGLQSHMISALTQAEKNKEEGDDKRMNTQTYSAIFVSCNNGYSEDVFEAARKAGATGGTIIKGIREVTEETSEKLGIPLCDEQDFILIIVKRDNKKEIMTAIINECGILTEARANVMSFPIDEVFGLS